MTKKRISVQSAKAKGRKLQQEIGKRFAEIVNIEFGKDKLISSREMGQSGTDIRLIGKALEKIPYSIECKRCENWSVHSWIKQAEDNVIEGTDWLLFAKRNRSNSVVIMDAETFFKLFEKTHKSRRRKC